MSTLFEPMECCRNSRVDSLSVTAEENPKLTTDDHIYPKGSGLGPEPTFFIVVKKLQPVDEVDLPVPVHQATGPLTEKALRETSDGNLYEGQWCGPHMHGQGKLVKKDGSVYTGDFQGSKAHGHGRFVASDGSTYEGQWANNACSGFGKYVNKARSLTISGVYGPCAEAVNGSYVSAGNHNNKSLFRKQLDGDKWLRWVPGKRNWMISTTADKEANNGVGWAFCVEKDLDDPALAKRWVVWTGTEWKEQSDVHISSSLDGTSYEGQWLQDESNGVGVLRWPDGSSYEGQFLHSSKHGEGVVKSTAGEIIFQGTFKHDTMSEGTYYYPDGRKYVGRWRDGHMDGNGMLCWPDGAVYRGNFRQGVRTGEGQLSWPDGRSYSGQWMNGKQEGTGTYIDAKGNKTVGKWKAGCLYK
eukprot:TRINITY_DN23013_c0_g1_i1.p1 TRINITY_DN23013_c0_g1~~TRINITY_DN23013_c0_g1_i1.p1  ORF type:complete len:412 (-),score=75.33 TRINITY_DN23013_c0_g1_i1:149-1384(-)